MLRVVGTAPAAGKLDLPGYLPFLFATGEGGFCTWVQQFERRMVLTIKAEQTTGRVSRVVLVTIGAPITDGDPYPSLEVRMGLPVVDLEPFHLTAELREPASVIEEHLFRTYGNGTKVSIVFDEDRQATECIRSDRVGFCVSGDHLCGLIFFDLSAEEYEGVRSRARDPR